MEILLISRESLLKPFHNLLILKKQYSAIPTGKRMIYLLLCLDKRFSRYNLL